MAIYDCFQYFNEDHIVDLRLNILNEHVDYFVISESTKTRAKNSSGKAASLSTLAELVVLVVATSYNCVDYS